MTVISGTGVFSGIDSAKIIEQLMAVERKPIEGLKKKKGDFNTKISKLGNLTNLLKNLKDTLKDLKGANLVPYKVHTTNPNIVTASASKNAQEGIYTLKVVRLAESQSIFSETFSTPDAAVADLDANSVQKISIKVGDSEENIITIDAMNNSLGSLKNAINATGLKIRANIINDGSGYRLVLTSTETGASNRIVIRVDENNDGIFETLPEEVDNSGLSRLAFNATYDVDGNVSGGIANLSQSKKAIDAVVEVDGITVTRSKNQISDIVENVTLQLQNVSNGEYIKLNVEKDYPKSINNLNTFVSNYNNLMTALNDSSIKDDYIVRQLKASVRSILTDSYNGKTLTNYGLNHDKTGVLSLDSVRFDNFIRSNYVELVNTFDSVINNLENNLNNYLEKIIPQRKENYNKLIANMDKKIESLEDKLNQMEVSYRKKFYELEKTIAGLQKNGDYLTQTLSKWGNNK